MKSEKAKELNRFYFSGKFFMKHGVWLFFRRVNPNLRNFFRYRMN